MMVCACMGPISSAAVLLIAPTVLMSVVPQLLLLPLALVAVLAGDEFELQACDEPQHMCFWFMIAAPDGFTKRSDVRFLHGFDRISSFRAQFMRLFTMRMVAVDDGSYTMLIWSGKFLNNMDIRMEFQPEDQSLRQDHKNVTLIVRNDVWVNSDTTVRISINNRERAFREHRPSERGVSYTTEPLFSEIAKLDSGPYRLNVSLHPNDRSGVMISAAHYDFPMFPIVPYFLTEYKMLLTHPPRAASLGPKVRNSLTRSLLYAALVFVTVIAGILISFLFYTLQWCKSCVCCKQKAVPSFVSQTQTTQSTIHG